MIYYLQSLLLPLYSSCYNSKLLKVIILNIWFFIFFHSLRELLNIHKINISADISVSNLITVLFSLFYLYTLTYVNYKISYRNEVRLLPKNVTQFLEFLLIFLITSFLYIYIYIKIPPEIVNNIYKVIIFSMAAFGMYYFFLNFKFLNEKKPMVSSYFITLSKIAIIFSMLCIPGMIVVKHFYPSIPTFFILLYFFTFYNFKLYKLIHNNIVIFPMFETHNKNAFQHFGL